MVVVAMGVADYLSMVRMPNSIMSGVGAVFMLLVFTGYDLASVGLARLIAGFVTGFTITAASMLINDVVDMDVDRVNKPWKPLPSGRASPRIATVLSLLLAALGVLVNLFINVYAAATALVYALMGLGYSFLRRHWWSQLVVAASTTGPIVYGYTASPRHPGDILVVAGLSTTIFIVTLGREVLKAVQDIQGDSRQGYRTIPIVYGLEAARRLILLAGVTGPLAGVATGFIGGSGTTYKALISVAGILYFYTMTKAYRSISNRRVLEEARRETLGEMMLGLVAFWLYRA